MAYANGDEVTRLADGSNMVVIGMGEYSNLGESIYIGAVYVPILDVRIEPGSSKRMEMRITTEGLSARRFTRMWMDAVTLGTNRDQRNLLAEQIQQFSRTFQENLQRGDQITFDYMASQDRTLISFNGVTAATIGGGDFYQVLLNAWVGQTPVSGELKAGVLGKQADSEKERIGNEFAMLTYSDARMRMIADFYAPPPPEPETSPEDEQPVADVVDEAAAEEARLAEIARQEEEARLAEEERIRQAEEAARLEAERIARAEQEALEEQRRREEEARIEAEQLQLSNAYRSELVAWLREYIEYPLRAYERRQTGKVELEIVSNRTGEIIGQTIVLSSGNSLLDGAALEMLKKGAPLPAMPEALQGDSYSFIMPINFTL